MRDVRNFRAVGLSSNVETILVNIIVKKTTWPNAIASRLLLS